jgi:hypothetical protein
MGNYYVNGIANRPVLLGHGRPPLYTARIGKRVRLHGDAADRLYMRVNNHEIPRSSPARKARRRDPSFPDFRESCPRTSTGLPPIDRHFRRSRLDEGGHGEAVRSYRRYLSRHTMNRNLGNILRHFIETLGEAEQRFIEPTKNGAVTLRTDGSGNLTLSARPGALP